MAGRPKATDPVIQRNYYLARSDLQAFLAAAAKDGRKPTDIVADLVRKWTADAANPQ